MTDIPSETYVNGSRHPSRHPHSVKKIVPVQYTMMRAKTTSRSRANVFNLSLFLWIHTPASCITVAYNSIPESQRPESKSKREICRWIVKKNQVHSHRRTANESMIDIHLARETSALHVHDVLRNRLSDQRNGWSRAIRRILNLK